MLDQKLANMFEEFKKQGVFYKKNPLLVAPKLHKMSKLLLEIQGQFVMTFYVFFEGVWVNLPFGTFNWNEEDEDEKREKQESLAYSLLKAECDKLIIISDMYIATSEEVAVTGIRPRHLKKREALQTAIIYKDNHIHTITTEYRHTESEITFLSDVKNDLTHKELPVFSTLFEIWGT